MIQTIATDLDGTLFYPKSRFRLINSKNKRFLVKYLNNPKNNLVIVSGRNLTMARKIKKRLENKDVSMVACNGACIYHKGTVIEENVLSKDDIRFLYNYALKNYDVHIFLFFTNIMPLIVTVKDVSKSFEVIGKLGMKMQFAYYEDFAFGDKELEKYLANPDCKFYKFMPCFGFRKQGIQKAKDNYNKIVSELGGKYEIMWSNNTVEFMKKNVNKANALKNLLNMLELKESETAVAGDSGNDIPLFEAFENSFCMAQAQDVVKSKAKNIIKGVYEIEKYL